MSVDPDLSAHPYSPNMDMGGLGMPLGSGDWFGAETIGLNEGTLFRMVFDMMHLPPYLFNQTNVRVAVGVDDPYVDRAAASTNRTKHWYDAGMAGDMVDLLHYDEHKRPICWIEGEGKVENATHRDTACQEWGGQHHQAHYTHFTGRDDSICIAYAAIAWVDREYYALDTTWGKECGQKWYPSNLYMVDEHKFPSCVWLSRHDETMAKSMSVHWPTFRNGNMKMPSFNTSYYCNKAEGINFFDMARNKTHCKGDNTWNKIWDWAGLQRKPYCGWDTPAELAANNDAVFPDDSLKSSSYGNAIWSTPVTADHERRALPRIRPRGKALHETRLVHSDAEQHSAVEVCQSDTSYGPDFYSAVEGMHCDMGTKTLKRACTAEDDIDCFDAEALHMRSEDGLVKRELGYSKVMHWGR